MEHSKTEGWNFQRNGSEHWPTMSFVVQGISGLRYRWVGDRKRSASPISTSEEKLDDAFEKELDDKNWNGDLCCACSAALRNCEYNYRLKYISNKRKYGLQTVCFGYGRTFNVRVLCCLIHLVEVFEYLY